MTEVKYTEGPWVIGDTRGGYADINAPSARYPWTGLARVVVEMEGVSKLEPYGMGEANARLIAAAPELLEALMAIETDGLHNHNTRRKPWWGQVRAAIAKARGEA